MFRGQRPKPAHLKILEGNPGRRKIPNEPRPPCDRIPEPPPFITGLALAEWHQLAPQLFVLGMLTDLDVGAFAAYCQAYSRWVTAERHGAEMAERDELTSGLMIKTTNGNSIQNPLIGTANKALRDMLRCAAEFGLTPTARARLSLIPQPTKRNKFEGLIG